MNNKDYISTLSQRTGYTQQQCQRMVQQVIDAMMTRIEEGESVAIPNFGTFEVKKRMERIFVNPSTKQRMLAPPKLVLGFRPGAQVKEKLKKGGDNE